MKSATKHIAFIATRLDLPGGIEKAIITTANLLTEKGYKITLLVADVTTDCFYEVDKRIVINKLNVNFGIDTKGNALTRKVKMVKDVLALRSWFKTSNVDIIITTEYHLTVVSILSGLQKKFKVYSWEHHHKNSLRRNTFWRKLMDYSYPKLSGIICLNDEENELFSKLNKHIVTIPNFVPVQPSYVVILSGPKIILTVARLNYTKGIDRLLDVAKLVLDADENIIWKIIGDGEAKPFIQQFIADINLSDRLLIEDPKSNDLSEEYRSADIFVLTSRFECFPMTLLEAMSFSIPCIAFDCDTGPRHIIRNGVNGLLAEDGDTDLMAELIMEVLSYEGYRDELARQARIDSRSFSPEHTYLLWDRLLSQ